MILFIIASIGFFLVSIRRVLFWTSLWQVKEYRLDRLLVHFKETTQGRKIFFSPLFISNLFAIALYSVVVVSDSFTFLYQLLITFMFVLGGILFIIEIGKFSFKRPVLTTKALIVSLSSIFVLSLLYAQPLVDEYLWLLLISLLIPFFIAFFVGLLSFPSEIITDIYMLRAKKKLDRHKKIRVIAVSGSYGKSSTKEYLAHVLSSEFSVVNTPLSNNTPLAIAKTILNKINDTTEIFIVEIGSYKKGEIAKICQMLHPDITITTSVSDQHLSLFGSIEKVLETESELLHAMSKNGLALFNANSPLVYKLAEKTQKKKLFYGTETAKNKSKISILGKDIQAKKQEISFSVKLGKISYTFSTSLLGVHSVENILPGILIAHKLGLEMSVIRKAVASLQPLPKTMRRVVLQNNITVVDDTFNASPESVFSALSYMNLYNKKKFFVMAPLIELGKNAKERHREIGESLGICTKVFVLNKNYYKQIKEGLNKSHSKTQLILASTDEVVKSLQEKAQKGDIIVFEGKEAGRVLTKIV